MLFAIHDISQMRLEIYQIISLCLYNDDQTT
jgi:hypothetical protein